MTTEGLTLYSYDLYSYLSAFFAYGLLLILSLWGIRRYSSGFIFFLAVLASFLWSAYTSYTLFNDDLYTSSILPVETLRNLAWFIYLLAMLNRLEPTCNDKTVCHTLKRFNINFLYPSNYSILLIVGTVFVFVSELFPELMALNNQILGLDFRLLSHVCFAIAGLVLVEQLYRNTISEQRWAIKFICLGLAGLFIYDFIIYSKSLLFSNLDFILWNARGVVNALTVPLLAISVVRLQEKAKIYTVSRTVIFHTSALVGTGFYLIFMSLAGFYIQAYGGDWGEIAQILFIFLALLILIILMFSGSIRARLKLYFNKHFVHYRYDYREEWLALSKKLAELDSFNELSHFMIKTLADLVDSSGGGLWLKNEQGDFYLAENYQLNFSGSDFELIHGDTAAIQFMEKTQWVIDLYEYEDDPEVYEEMDLSRWVNYKHGIWLMIPLFKKNNLEAFIVLAKPRVVRQLNWEDHDMLRTVGMQLANAFALSQASEELSTARQFEAYSRLSAFILHDLKNLVAQVSLIVINAEKHKSNPEFIDDAIDTLENVVTKMQKLVSQLKQRNVPDVRSQFDLVCVIKDIIKQQSQHLPRPQFKVTLSDCMIYGEQEKISAVLGHLVQNAQEATADEGQVMISLLKSEKNAIIKIVDSGCGMDKKFIAERLFKPFDTTKGNAGMGIGVYEAKDYILNHSGSLSVISDVNQGTEFTIQLPMCPRKIARKKGEEND